MNNRTSLGVFLNDISLALQATELLVDNWAVSPKNENNNISFIGENMHDCVAELRNLVGSPSAGSF